MRSILFIILVCSAGCSLFRKTSKTNSNAAQSSTKQLEASQLILKKAEKETQIFTYWNDSGFYQVQYIKEQIDEAKSAKLIEEDKQEAKQASSTKKMEPVATWIYLVILLVLLACYMIFKRFLAFG